MPLPDTAVSQVSSFLDRIYGGLFLRGVLQLIPDVERFSFTSFVAEGVSVSGGQLLMSFLYLLGYLVPWAVLAYYLLRWREVAAAT